MWKSMKPHGKCSNVQTHYTGVTLDDIKNATLHAKDEMPKIRSLLHSKIIIGHSPEGDIEVFSIFYFCL